MKRFLNSLGAIIAAVSIGTVILEIDARKENREREEASERAKIESQKSSKR